LPSQRALAGLHALIALATGIDPTEALQACALAVPVAFLPAPAQFVAGWQAFAAAHLQVRAASPRLGVEQAARALWLLRGRSEAEQPAEDHAADEWDLARVLRRLERTLAQSGLLVRRARWLGLLAYADVAFRERAMRNARVLVLAEGQISARHDLASIDALDSVPARGMPPRSARQACFDALVYDACVCSPPSSIAYTETAARSTSVSASAVSAARALPNSCAGCDAASLAIGADDVGSGARCGQNRSVRALAHPLSSRATVPAPS